MLSDLQREKITHYFHSVLDQDKNGVLEENDFKEISESLCVLWGYKPGTPDYKHVMEIGYNNWKLFQQFFEKQGGTANEQQFLSFFEAMLSPGGEAVYEKFVLKSMGNIFDSFDHNGDGVISINEYSDMFMCYHIPIKYSAKAFIKLDRNGDDSITKQELLKAINEFFKSNDPDAPGNWLFGFWGDKD